MLLMQHNVHWTQNIPLRLLCPIVLGLWCNVLTFAICPLCQVAALTHAHQRDNLVLCGVPLGDDVIDWSTEVLWTAVSGHKQPVFILLACSVTLSASPASFIRQLCPALISALCTPPPVRLPTTTPARHHQPQCAHTLAHSGSAVRLQRAVSDCREAWVMNAVLF